MPLLQTNMALYSGIVQACWVCLHERDPMHTPRAQLAAREVHAVPTYPSGMPPNGYIIHYYILLLFFVITLLSHHYYV